MEVRRREEEGKRGRRGEKERKTGTKKTGMKMAKEEEVVFGRVTLRGR